MITEGVDRGAADFQIFTSGIVASNQGLHLVAHRLLECSPAGDCCLASRFSATPRCFHRMTAT
jgi:hypothetical protein